ncbi:Hsp70 protein that interacts with Zuo1p [Entomophthora muscae]|uniref:Hsp70 protein that interacts with Zuo1p n=1 Tax=Entomophthora muscae TaxID=34485 RepID=A0ACC2UDE6_9FUNG|nr:Hsp70 protein that interacts with Zuo1p [Entomophthora muscae]
MSGQATDSQRQSVLGLTIGSVYSSLAIIDKDGHPNVIANEDGERLIPTCVAYRNGEVFAGSSAQNQAVRNPENTLYGFFELLGQTADSEIVKHYISTSPFKLVEKDGQFAYEVQIDEKPVTVTAHEIAVRFLLMLKENAEAFTGNTVIGTVIGVPSHYTEVQRTKITAAANEAGLKVEQIANEPSLALLAYDYLDHDVTADKTVVVVDFGGRSLDITLVSAKAGIYTIIASENSREVSGLALDDVLVQHFAKEFKTKNKVDITSNKRALSKLRVACELTKKTLSSTSTAPCSVESLAEGIDYHANVNRIRFEMLSSKIFNKVVAQIEKVMESAGYHASDINEVVLIGGGSRIPKIRSLLSYVFPESTQIRSEIETDEAVSRGCVMQSSLLQSLHETEDVSLEKLAAEENLSSANHTTAPIGLIDSNGAYVSLIHSDTPLPLRRVFRMSHPKGQVSAYVALHQGEKETVVTQPEPLPKEEGDEEEPEVPEPITTYRWKAAGLVAELALDSINGASAQIELQIQVDESGKLTAILRDIASGKTVKTDA